VATFMISYLQYSCFNVLSIICMYHYYVDFFLSFHALLIAAPLPGPAPLSSSSPSSATLRHTMSNTAALIRPYLRNTGIDSEANSEVNEDPADTQVKL